MNTTDIRMLWVYAGELWGSTFQVPDDSRLRQVKEQVWLDVLGDLDAALVRRAMVNLRAHFAPTPQELREASLELARAESGARAKPDTDEALAELYRLVSRYGYVRPSEALAAAEKFHPALAAVIQAIGWQEVCEDSEPGVFRGQFRVLYEQASTRIIRAEQPQAPVLAAVRELAGQLKSGDE